jgi:hypothetical protein
MALSVVGGWESGLEQAGIPVVLKNDWICFRTSSPLLGNNPSLQSHSFCENWGKCNQICGQTNEAFPSSKTYNVADSSCLPGNEAYKHSLSLSSLLLSMPCWEGTPNGRHFFAEKFIKRWFCSKTLCLFCCMLSACRLASIICDLSSIGFDFHLHVDLGSTCLFPSPAS